jgi:hypothetical protein
LLFTTCCKLARLGRVARALGILLVAWLLLPLLEYRDRVARGSP